MTLSNAQIESIFEQLAKDTPRLSENTVWDTLHEYYDPARDRQYRPDSMQYEEFFEHNATFLMLVLVIHDVDIL